MSCFRRGWKKLFGADTRRVLLLGLDAAGKTTILYYLMKKAEKTVPTIGFNVERISIPPVEFFVWDVSGQQKTRTFWRHYYHGTNGIIFVIDSNDGERLQQAAEELLIVCGEEELKGAAIVILANKMDLPHARSVEEISKILQIDELSKDLGRKIFIQPTQANTGKGIQEGLTWLANNMEGVGKGKGKGKGKEKENEKDKGKEKPSKDPKGNFNENGNSNGNGNVSHTNGNSNGHSQRNPNNSNGPRPPSSVHPDEEEDEEKKTIRPFPSSSNTLSSSSSSSTSFPTSSTSIPTKFSSSSAVPTSSSSSLTTNINNNNGS